MDLERLHTVVPATEEEDLLEQVRQERLAAEAARGLGLEEPAAEPPRREEEPAEEPFSEPQVLGMLEHHLGAQVLDED